MRVGAETLLAQIVRMVSEAQRSRAPIQRLAELRSQVWFVPLVIAVAIVTFIVWALVWSRASPGTRACQRGRGPHHRVPVRPWTGDADVDHGGHRTRCGVGRAVPQCRGARRFSREVTTIVVDKTGTLTEGKPRLVTVEPAQAASMRPRCCDSPASLENVSEHPLATAIVAGARERRRHAGWRSRSSNPALEKA